MAGKSIVESSIDGGPLTYQSSLWELIETGCSRVPDNEAVVAMHQPAGHLSGLIPARPNARDECLCWTYTQLRTATFRLASSLLARGAKRGDTIATFIPNCADFVLFYWTAALLRLTFVPLDIKSLDPARHAELRYYLSTLKPSIVVTNDDQGAAAIDRMSEELSFSIIVQITRSHDCESWTSLDNMATDIEGDSTTSGLVDDGPDNEERTGIILFTSGTSTGKPKGVPMSVKNILSGHATYARSRSIDSTHRFILHTANFRAACASYTMACASNGATLVMPGEGFSTTGVFEAIEKQRATNIWAVPAQVFALIDDPSFASRDLSPFRLLCISGDMITRSILDRATQAFKTARVISGHGMTEGIGSIGWWDPPEHIPSFGEIVALGTVLPGTRVKIVDDDGRIVAVGETGELHIGGPKMLSAYLDDAQADLFYEDEAGNWVITGDRARIDADGRVYILGRSKDIIKRKGIPIPPAVIESCLNRYGMVRSSNPNPHISHYILVSDYLTVSMHRHTRPNTRRKPRRHNQVLRFDL